MKINEITTNYSYLNKKVQSFRSGIDEENVIKKYDGGNTMNCSAPGNNKKTSLAVIFGIILGVLAAHDTIAMYRHNKASENQNASLTNEIYNVSKEMEDTYQTVLSNKLQSAKNNLSAVDYNKVQNAINILENSSKK